MVTIQGLRQLAESSARASSDRAWVMLNSQGLAVDFPKMRLLVTWEMLEELEDDDLPTHLAHCIERATQQLQELG